MFNKRFLILCLLIAVAASFFLSACAPAEKVVKVDLKKTIKIQEKESSKTSSINIGVGSMITPQEGYIYYKKLLQYIGEKLGKTVNFIDKESYQEVNELLAKGQIDLAFVCGGPYVDGQRKFGLTLLAAPQVGGKTVYYSYIIVKKDSNINRFEDLEGKSFVFADPLSNTGKLAPSFVLAKLGKKADSFFKEYFYSYGHDKSIKAVALGIADGAAVDSLIWNYLNERHSKYTRDTKIINTLGPYGIPPVVVRPALEKELKVKLKNILLNMHKDEKGAMILKGMAIDKFVNISNSAYDSIRKIKSFLKL